MAKNSITLKGNLTRDPFFDYLSGRNSPVPFMRFTLAVDRHPPRREGTDYLQIVAYGQRALQVLPFLMVDNSRDVHGVRAGRQGEIQVSLLLLGRQAKGSGGPKWRSNQHMS